MNNLNDGLQTTVTPSSPGASASSSGSGSTAMRGRYQQQKQQRNNLKTNNNNNNNNNNSGTRCSGGGHHRHNNNINTATRNNTNRIFQIGSSLITFQIPSKRRIMDVIIDCVHYTIEGFVYIIGPILILLALSIITLLAYTYFYIILPMMKHKYELNTYRLLILSIHTIYVIFIIINVLYNYIFCVIQKHKGNNYNRVVRELAHVTNFVYPNTNNDLIKYRNEFHDKMVLRMQRRQVRYNNNNMNNDIEQQQQQQNENEDNDDSLQQQSDLQNNVTRRHPNNSISAKGVNTTNKKKQKLQKQPVIRSWMLMGPYEWGYCSNSNQPKPPRSHYDHVTKSLILNLDHYCPWMFNAIGYFNYRYFVNFMIYIFFGMLYGTAVMLEPFLLTKSTEYRQQLQLQRRAIKTGILAANQPMQRIAPMVPFREEKMILTLSFMLCVAVGIAILLLGGFHVYLTLSGQTTIEFHANWAAKRNAKRNGQKNWNNPYSKGTWKGNWEQIYGPNTAKTPIHILLSLLPSRREPEFLPVPIPGQSCLRNEIHLQEDDNKNNVIINNNNSLLVEMGEERITNNNTSTTTTTSSSEIAQGQRIRKTNTINLATVV